MTVNIIVYHFFRHFCFLASSAQARRRCMFSNKLIYQSYVDVQVDRSSDFTTWRVQWESYMSLSGLAEESNKKKVQAQTLCFLYETLSIVQNLRLSSDEMKDVTTIIAVIKKYIDDHINKSVECRNFQRCIQQLGECFDDFLLALRKLATLVLMIVCKRTYVTKS